VPGVNDPVVEPAPANGAAPEKVGFVDVSNSSGQPPEFPAIVSTTPVDGSVLNSWPLTGESGCGTVVELSDTVALFVLAAHAQSPPALQA
jgi:hypothetical protein